MAALFTFISCGTYEIGYTFLLLWGLWALLLHDRFWDAVCTGLPLLGGELAALFFYRWNQLNVTDVYEGTALSLIPGKILLTTLQQMSGSFPLNEPLAAGAPWPQQWSAGDFIWPLVLALIGVTAVYRRQIALTAKQTILLVLAGLTLLGAPALLIGLSVKYQDQNWVSWKYAYIPAVVGTFGVTLLFWVALVWLFHMLQARGARRWLQLTVAAVLVVMLTGGSAWQRAATRERYPVSERYDRALLEASVAAGIADPAGSLDPVLCDFDVWGGSVEAQQMFFRRYGDREVNARPFMDWMQQPPQTAGNVYRMGEYAGYGGYATVWFGQALPGATDTVQKLQVYVDGGTIPDTAVLKYYHREADGSETIREIPLADLPQTERDESGRYFVAINDDAVCVPKIMIWAG